MKNINRYWRLFPLLFVLAVVASCDKGGDEIVNLKQEGRIITVTGINPSSGYVGGQIEIIGTNFGISKELVNVYIGSDEAEVSSCEDTKIVVTVPEGATSGKIALTLLGDRVVSDLLYDVLGQPGVTAIEPASGFVGSEIAFIGHDFGSNTESVKVFFSGTETAAEVISCENEKIVVKVPDGVQSGPIRLSIAHLDNLNLPAEFRRLEHATVEDLTPATGYPGSRVVLTGTNFLDGEMTVLFGEKEAEIESCAATEMVLKVPADVVLGENTVTVKSAYETIGQVLKFMAVVAPVVESVSAQEGYVGQEITLTGKHLPATAEAAEAVKVLFGDKEAELVPVSDTELKVKVPAVEVFDEEMALVVMASDLTIYKGTFTVKQTPVITSVKNSIVRFSENLVKVGDEIIVTGTHFTNAVEKAMIGDKGAKYEYVSETEMKVTVPEGFTGGKVTLRFKDIPADVVCDSELVLLANGTDVAEYVLKNYKQPFVGTVEGSTAEWQLPADWEMNSVVRDGVLGLQVKNGVGVISFQRGWGKNCRNGKMWQSVSLPAGKYTLRATSPEITLKNGKDHVFMFITKGTSEADIPSATVSGKSGDFDGTFVEVPNRGYTVTVPTPHETEQAIELTETTDVLIGFLVYLDNNSTWFKVSSLELIYEE